MQPFTNKTQNMQKFQQDFALYATHACRRSSPTFMGTIQIRLHHIHTLHGNSINSINSIKPI